MEVLYEVTIYKDIMVPDEYTVTKPPTKQDTILLMRTTFK